MSSIRRCCVVVIFLTVMLSCGDGHLRGRTSPSPDDMTYLAFDLAELPPCDPLFVDGREWPPPYDEPRAIEPGEHLVRCGKGDTGISFTVPAKVVFVFDYWGP